MSEPLPQVNTASDNYVAAVRLRRDCQEHNDRVVEMLHQAERTVLTLKRQADEAHELMRKAEKNYGLALVACTVEDLDRAEAILESEII